MAKKQKDNSTLLLKASLRRNLLKLIDNPVVMETHGGYGGIWSQCYKDIADGVVMEKDPTKCNVLCKQRPEWAVYECDCEAALWGGIGSHLPVNFVDFDPYGEPWPMVDAFFQSEREFPDTIAIVVNDGLRQKLKMNGGWSVESMSDMVGKYGNNALYKNYLEICRELLNKKAGNRGYTITRWAGYYCGHLDQMTHYAAMLNKSI